MLATGAVDLAVKFNEELLVGKEAAIVAGVEVTGVEAEEAEIEGAEWKLNTVGAIDTLD